MNGDDFLIEEYKRFAEAFWKNEEVGEKRLNYFITLTTAILGAVITLITAKGDLLEISELNAYRISTAALGGTFLFGLVTFFRMLQRDHVTDEYKTLMDYIRDRFKNDRELADYDLPFKDSRHWLLRGSLSVNVAVMNSIILAALPAVWLTGALKWIGVIGIFLISFSLHSLGIKKRNDES